MTSLTQEEASERAAMLDVRRYDVAVDLTELPTGPRVRSTSTIEFACRTPGADSFADVAATVVRATLNGRELGAAENERLTLTGLEAVNTLVVEAVQDDTRTGAGVHKAVDPADGEVYVWMSFEPDEARRVWACFDQPDLKAPHTFTVTAPEGWLVTTNTPGGATPPLSPYNTVINAGPFHELRREIDGYDLGLYCRRSLAAVLERDADELFELTAKGLRFYGETFAMPFPQRRYDQVFVPEFGGAMENYGCVTWADTFLHRAEPTPAERLSRAAVLLHEMAHMWFGNIVTMHWWDDLWLNESFADFACHWAADEIGLADAWAGYLVNQKLVAYMEDQGPMTHPIRLPVRDVAQAASLFDAITYPKGASVLRQLRVFVGEDAFRAGLVTYFARFAWRNASLTDLFDALAEAGGRDLTAWRAGWLETAGPDRFTLETDPLMLVGRGPSGPPRPQVVAVTAFTHGVRVEQRRLEITSGRTPLEPVAGADFYLVNDDDLTFATSRPVPLATAATLPTPIARGVSVVNVWDALFAGEVSAAETASCLAAVLPAETAPALVEPYLRLAVEVADYWSPPSRRAAVNAELAAAFRKLADQPVHRRPALRALARVTDDVDTLTELAGDDVDLAWRALVRRSELGEDTSDAVAKLLARDPDPDGRLRALVVRAAAPDPAAKAETWRALTERAVMGSMIGEVAQAFWRPGQERLLTEYPEAYREVLARLRGSGMIAAAYVTRHLFPVLAVDQAYLDRPAPDGVAPVVAARLTARADVVSRMLRSRSTE
jgi:aminopeptidase N